MSRWTMPRLWANSRADGDFLRQADGVVDGELLFAGEAATEGLALDEGHDVVEEAVGLAGVDQAENVGMLQARGGLDLGEEAVTADDGAQLGVQDLDGDLAVVLQVFGEVDRGHAALAQLALEAVAVAERGTEAGDGVGHAYFFPGGHRPGVEHVAQGDQRGPCLSATYHDEVLAIGGDIVLGEPAHCSGTGW